MSDNNAFAVKPLGICMNLLVTGDLVAISPCIVG